jgi:hypothetical protein
VTVPVAAPKVSIVGSLRGYGELETFLFQEVHASYIDSIAAKKWREM